MYIAHLLLLLGAQRQKGSSLHMAWLMGVVQPFEKISLSLSLSLSLNHLKSKCQLR